MLCIRIRKWKTLSLTHKEIWTSTGVEECTNCGGKSEDGVALQSSGPLSWTLKERCSEEREERVYAKK